MAVKTVYQSAYRSNKCFSRYPLGNAPPWVVAGDPIVLFSDLISAPRQGWSAAEPNKGAVVSIFGFNFGAFSAGNTFVTIGGVSITELGDYPITWGSGAQNPHLERVTFHLNSSIPLGEQNLTITVNGKTSLPIKIKVTANSIYFADPNATSGTGTLTDPWLSPVNFTSTAIAGDVLYCRSGVYSFLIDGGNAAWYIRPDGAGSPANDGTATDPVAICGYPGETCTIQALDAIGGSMYRGIVIKSQAYTIANLTVRTTGLGIDAGGASSSDNHRIINNDVSGVQSSDASGHIITQGSNSVVLGNKAHGGRSGNKLDHAIYPSGDASRGGCHIAWNYIVDNNFDTGPLISINHQDDRIPSNARCKSHYVYANFLDSSAFPCSGITVYDLSWDAGTDTAGEPEPAYVFNNVLIGCGVDRTFPALSAWGAHSRWFNNTLYNCVGTGMDISNARVISCEVKNNIFHCQTGHTHEYIRELNLDPSAQITIDSNVYFNSTGGLTDPLVADVNGITTDPELAADLVNATITQAAWTKTAGVSVQNVERDYNGIERADVYGVGAIA